MIYACVLVMWLNICTQVCTHTETRKTGLPTSRTWSVRSSDLMFRETDLWFTRNTSSTTSPSVTPLDAWGTHTTHTITTVTTSTPSPLAHCHYYSTCMFQLRMHAEAEVDTEEGSAICLHVIIKVRMSYKMYGIMHNLSGIKTTQQILTR